MREYWQAAWTLISTSVVFPRSKMWCQVLVTLRAHGTSSGELPAFLKQRLRFTNSTYTAYKPSPNHSSKIANSRTTVTRVFLNDTGIATTFDRRAVRVTTRWVYKWATHRHKQRTSIQSLRGQWRQHVLDTRLGLRPSSCHAPDC